MTRCSSSTAAGGCDFDCASSRKALLEERLPGMVHRDIKGLIL